MARQEQDREDLMRDATRLMPRSCWEVPEESEPVVLGLRSQNALSVYFGADPALHFNDAYELRRAYVDGALWVARDRQLVVLRRHRVPEQVELRSRTMPDHESTPRLAQLRQRLQRLEFAIVSGAARCTQTVSDGEFDPCLWATVLAQVTKLRLAVRPHVR